MKQSIETIGMIGFGAMGQFMAQRMFEGCEVVAHDPNITETEVNGVPMVDWYDAANRDAVVLATPARALQETARDLRTDVINDPSAANPLVVDVCSVKEYPTDVFKLELPPRTEILLSHPLFGPQSAKDSFDGHKVIVTEERGDKASEMLERWKGLGLEIVDMDATTHDKLMARVQAVPFMLGRIAARNDMLWPFVSNRFKTPSLTSVQQLAKLNNQQSDDLFDTVVNFNHYAAHELDEIVRQARLLGLNHFESDGPWLLAKHKKLIEEEAKLAVKH